MEIRSAEENDIPAIVGLLKLSLGESLMPKSEAFWRWKHIDNPFGKSPVLLAIDNHQLIGIRAFMRWEWQQEGGTFKAVRAVDTATHPQYQGKGIFSKLSLNLVEQCRQEGVDFIFNSPNKVSKPGYLKMGWVSNDKMKLHIRPVYPFGKRTSDFDATYAITDRHQTLLSRWKKNSASLTTRVLPDFLSWRYGQSPNVRYHCFTDNEQAPRYLTIFRLKSYRLGTEFRICDSFENETNPKAWSQHLLQVVRASGANIITSAQGVKLFPEVSLKAGPEITIYPLSIDRTKLSYNNWKPSLGDMEVF